MFKKRTRPAGSRAKDTPTASAEAGPSTISPSRSPPPEETEPAEDLTAEIDELILLRKLRKGKQGIDLAKFNQGPKKVARDDLGTGAAGYGLHAPMRKRNEDDEVDEFADEAERMMRMVRSNNFTQQTNALDTDKHMLAYIESEMAKRKGKAEKEGRSLEPLDPQSELYKMAAKYQWDMEKVEEEEGNVTNSMGMLTSIPEMDLGMENRLRNIEATEKAKREMEERRKNETKTRRRPEDEDFAAARYHRPTLRIASDIYAHNDEQREAAGLPPPRYNDSKKDNQQATDAEVYDRFKKRMKR